MRGLFSLIVLAAAGFGGWIVGSLYPAPDELLIRIHARALQERALSELKTVDWLALRGALSTQQVENLLRESAAAGQAIMIDRSDGGDTGGDQAYYAPATMAAPTATSAAAAGSGAPPVAAAPALAKFDSTLSLCPRLTVTNAPAVDAHRQVRNYAPIVKVSGVPLAVEPTRDACLSSGFGERSGHPHKGVDFQAPNGGPIYAAGDGVILEMKYRDDYGNMVLIDHGNGVYTRYAHLSTFQRGLAVGAKVKAGQQIGLMGNTAGYPLPIHLHYEVLLGDYSNPKASFGLVAHNPFEYRA
jgi:murein DD-endopeptidase MepM/ murein hydrolase activator NlpD